MPNSMLVVRFVHCVRNVRMAAPVVNGGDEERRRSAEEMGERSTELATIGPVTRDAGCRLATGIPRTRGVACSCPP
jgi:hypothetical protein